MKNLPLWAAAAAAVSAPLAAKEKPPVFVEWRAVMDKPAVTFEPAMGYVMVRGETQLPLYLVKVPTSEDQAVYDRVRAEALAESRTKYQKKLASWQRDKAAAAKTPGTRVGDEPVEPTEANFEFTPFALMAGVPIGPMNRFAKKDGSTYLEQLTPGTYRVYGLTNVVPGSGALGSCFCMGSVMFDVAAGQITDLGMMGKAEAVERPPGDSSYPAPLPTIKKLFATAGSDVAIDPRLSGAKIVPARFRPAGKMPNYFGLAVLRIPEIPGVLRYDRDRIVDLTGAN